MSRYPLLIDVAEERMDELVSEGELKEATKTRVIRDFSYLLEALLAVMPIELIKACLEIQGIEGASTVRTAEWLKAIAEERKRGV